MIWSNEGIALKCLFQNNVTLSDIYCCVGVLLLCHTTGFSFEETINFFAAVGKSASLFRMNSAHLGEHQGLLPDWAR